MTNRPFVAVTAVFLFLAAAFAGVMAF